MLLDPFAHKVTMVVTGLTFLKFMVSVTIQGGKRFKAGTRPPEDSRLSLAKGVPQHFGVDTQQQQQQQQQGKKGQNVDSNTKSVILEDIRWQRIVHNDLESIPLGLIVAWGSLFSAYNPNVHAALVSTFLVSRTLHTFFYAKGWQPYRALAWFGGVLSVFGLAINGVLGVLV